MWPDWLMRIGNLVFHVPLTYWLWRLSERPWTLVVGLLGMVLIIVGITGIGAVVNE